MESMLEKRRVIIHSHVLVCSIFWGIMAVQTEPVPDTATPTTGSHTLKTGPIQTLGGLEFAGVALLRRFLVHLREREVEDVCVWESEDM